MYLLINHYDRYYIKGLAQIDTITFPQNISPPSPLCYHLTYFTLLLSNDGLREMYYTARDKCPHVLPKLEEFIRSIIAERNNQNQMKASMEDVLNRSAQSHLIAILNFDGYYPFLG